MHREEAATRLTYLIAMGRSNRGQKRYIRAHYHSAKKTLVSIRYRPGVERRYTHIQAGVAGRKRPAVTLKEMNRLKRNYSAKKQCLYIPYGALCPASPSLSPESMPKITETNTVNTRYTKSRTPSPIVAKTVTSEASEK